MPETSRLTTQAQDQLSDIKQAYDIDVSTTKVVELAINELHTEKVGDVDGD